MISPTVAQTRGDAAHPSIQQLMIEVMRKVTHVGKDQRNREQKFSFRGIDDVINALGPAMREVGILCLPTVLWSERQMTKTVKGNNTRETIARVQYTFYGPRGDSITAVTEGESLDSGDKGTAKVFSVAYRIALIQAFALPTDEPDPDSFSYERGDPRDDQDDRRGEDRDDRRGRNDGERSRSRSRRSQRDDDARSDLIDTDDPEERRNQELTILKDKLRAKGIDKGAAADVFVDIFGEELPTAPADLIERFTALIVQLGQLPEIAAEGAEQHPAVARLMAVQDAKAENDRWGSAPSGPTRRDQEADQAGIDRDNVEGR